MLLLEKWMSNSNKFRTTKLLIFNNKNNHKDVNEVENKNDLKSFYFSERAKPY